MPTATRGIGDSDDERRGVDNGPRKDFTPMDDYPIRCRTCGYSRGAH